MTFTFLFVCTGNVCRSPLAELLTRSVLEKRLGEAAGAFAVTSAGTWGHDGSPMEREALSALAEHGIDGSHFRARELTPAMIADADVVLTAALEHRGAVLSVDPAAADRVFSMTEFARLIAGVDMTQLPIPSTARAAALVGAANALRDLPATSDDDVADPYGAPPRVFLRTAAQILALVTPLANALATPGSATPPRSPSAAAGTPAP